MIIHITSDELVEEYRESWKMEYIKHPSIDYATNAIHGWLNDEEVIIFYFKDYGFINDNRSNTYDLSVGKAGITVNIKKIRYD